MVIPAICRAHLALALHLVYVYKHVFQKVQALVKWFFFRLDLVWILTHMEPLAPNCQAQNCASHAPPTPQRGVKPKNPTCRQYDANFFNLPQGGFRPILDIVQRYVGLQGCMWQPKPISRGKAPFSQPLLVVLLGALHCNLYQGHTLGHKSHSLLKRKKLPINSKNGVTKKEKKRQ